MSTDGPVRVTALQRRRLQAIVRSTDASPRARQRATVILMSAEDMGGEEIARTLGVTRRTVTNIRTRWRLRGLPGLQDRPRSGRPPLADEAYRTELRRVVELDPRSLGYAFVRWTAPRLSAHLAKRSGVHLSTSQLFRLLHGQRFVWRRTKRTLRNLQDAAAVAQTQDLLARLKKKPLRRMRPSNSGSATG